MIPKTYEKYLIQTKRHKFCSRMPCQWYFAKFHLKDILSQEAIILIICGENSKIPNNLIFLKVKFLESKQRLQASTIY